MHLFSDVNLFLTFCRPAVASIYPAVLGWPRQQPGTPTASCSQQDRRGNQKRKGRMDQDKDSLISEVKLYIQGKQNKEFIHSFLLAGRCPALRSKAWAHAVITWKNKCHDHEDPHFLHLSPKLSLLIIMPFGMKNSFGLFRPDELVPSPASFLRTPHFTCSRGWVGTKPPQKVAKSWCFASNCS